MENLMVDLNSQNKALLVTTEERSIKYHSIENLVRVMRSYF